MEKQTFFLIAILIGIAIYVNMNKKESFYNYYNIIPTEIIDENYFNPNNDPNNYYLHMRVGDTRGVDLNCNNVTMYNILHWIDGDDPNILYNYVYRFDPSINILTPLNAPRIFKLLLRKLPQKHKYTSILRKCLYKPTRVA